MLTRRVYRIVAGACCAALLLSASPAYAGQSVQLTGKAQIEYVSIALETTGTLDYGSGAPGQTVTRSFTARNTGTLAADWDLLGSDASDSANDCWTIGTACDACQFVWAASGMGLTSMKLSKSWLRVADAVPGDATRTVNLAFTFPTTSKSPLVHAATATLRATGSGAPSPTAQSVKFDNTKHETLTAVANQPIDVTFDPSVMGCSANIHFTSGSFTKTSAMGQNVTYHSDGLPAGTYLWKCSMMDCCYGTLVVQ